MKKHFKQNIKQGYVFPLILLATISIAFFVLTLFQLESSHRDQLMHLNAYQHSLNVAYSVCVEQLAKLKEKQWDSRFFKDKPFIEVNKKLFNSTYDVCVEDYNPASFTFNIKIRTTSAGKSNLFYWRHRYIPNMLDFTRLTIPIFFDDLESELFEPARKSEVDAIVDKKLENFAKNKDKAEQINKEIISSGNPTDALDKIAAVPPGKAGKIMGGNSLRPDNSQIATKPSTAEKVDLETIVNSLDTVVENVDQIKFPTRGIVSYDSGLKLHIRTEPWGEIIAQIPPGASGFLVSGMRGDFFEVTYNGVTGYSHMNFIEVPGHTPSNEDPYIPPGVETNF
ncbi:MAG: hypothetical protein AB1403_04140 [Candidatus Riflebacteria bacterium]